METRQAVPAQKPERRIISPPQRVLKSDAVNIVGLSAILTLALYVGASRCCERYVPDDNLTQAIAIVATGYIVQRAMMKSSNVMRVLGRQIDVLQAVPGSIWSWARRISPT